jgi:transcriptional regulator with XRE-family HTH domain
MTPTSIGSTIKRLREEIGLSQRQVEERAGLANGYISLVEKGERTPKAGTLTKIAQALRVPIAALVGDDQASGLEIGSADLEGVDVNLLAIKAMDREEFELIARQLAERREKLERERKEFRRAERRRLALAKSPGQADKEEEPPRR